MPTTVPPRHGDAFTPSSLPQGILIDEAALRMQFFSKYDALTTEARTSLGTDAFELAPKVVEGAFVRAWDARQRLTSAVELQGFLTDDLRHAAARALSRRAAAHRLGGTGRREAHETIATNVEDSWKHVLHALEGEAHSPEVLARAASISRHEAAGHIAGLSKERPWWIPVSIVAVSAALIAGLFVVFDRMSEDSRVASALAGSDVRLVTTPVSQLGNLTLDDGSKVHLAPESKLTIPHGFGTKLRVVKLDGMATFDVAKGVERPFQVHGTQGIVVATGTSFTVRGYSDDSFETVVVHEGTVELRHGDVRTVAAAGNAMVLAAGSAARKATMEERDAADAWRRGFLLVNNEPLRAVLPLMRRWYGLTIVAKDTALLTHPVSMRASLESPRQAISDIEQSAGAKFGYVGKNMVFGTATPAARKTP